MRKPKKTFTDKKRGVIRGRFHESLSKSGEPIKRDIIGVEELEWDRKEDGSRRRRTEFEKAEIIGILYEKIRKELKQGASRGPVKGPSMLFTEGVQEWLDELGALRDEKTVKHYLESCNQFVGIVKDFKLKNPPEKLSKKFVLGLKKRGVSDATINSRIRDVMAFFNWAEEEKLSEPIKLKQLRNTDKDVGVFSEQNMMDMLARIEGNIKKATKRADMISGINQRRVWYMLRLTAMRPGEVRALPLKLIRNDQRHIEIKDQIEVGFRVKSRKEQIVPIIPQLEDFLDEDLKSRGDREVWYCDNGEGQPQWRDVQAMGRTFSKHLKALGVSGVKPLHGFRSTVNTNLLDNGATPQEVQGLARHEKLATTMGYYNPQSLNVAKMLQEKI